MRTISGASYLKKRLIAFAAACAVMLGAFGSAAPKAYADNDDAEEPLITEKAVISKACELLGVQYQLGRKGSPDVSGFRVYDRATIENEGIDCTGLIFWTFASLGASVQHTVNRGMNWAVVPIATYYWHDGYSPYKDLRLTVNGKSANVQIIRSQYESYDKDYFNADGGGYITPGSVVIMKTVEIGSEHGWIYIGYAEGGKPGIKALLESKYGITGISDDDITYNPNEGNHWRIESTIHPRHVGYNSILCQGQSMKYHVVTPIYKTGVTISNRRVAGTGECSGQAVFRIAGLPAEQPKTTTTTKPAAQPKPTATTKPVTQTKPTTTTKPVTQTKPTTTTKPVTQPKPASTTKPVTQTKPTTTTTSSAQTTPPTTAQTAPVAEGAE